MDFSLFPQTWVRLVLQIKAEKKSSKNLIYLQRDLDNLEMKEPTEGNLWWGFF